MYIKCNITSNTRMNMLVCKHKQCPPTDHLSRREAGRCSLAASSSLPVWPFFLPIFLFIYFLDKGQSRPFKG